MPTLLNQTAPDSAPQPDPAPGAGVARPFPIVPRPWAPTSLRGITGWACRWVDLFVLEAVFFGTLLFNYFHQTALTFSEFIQFRVSLRNLIIAAGCILLWRGMLRGFGLYDLKRISSVRGYVIRLLSAVTCCAGPVFLVDQGLRSQGSAPRFSLVFAALSFAVMSLTRGILLYFDRAIRPMMREQRNLLIVGTGSRAVDVYEEMKTNRDLDYHLVGYIDSDPQSGYVARDQVIGTLEDLESILRYQVIDEVVVALPMKSQYETIAQTIATCEQLGVQSQYFTHHFGTKVTKKRRATGRRAGRMVLEAVHQDSRRYLKRFVDFFGALFGIIALSPLLIATALAVRFTSPGPIIFQQERFGYNKRRFSMLKFRSMVVNAEALQKDLEHLNELSGPAFKIAKDPRLTPIGGFIRKMSIDELPQLFNVLLGDMSLVGPRPMPLRDVSRFSEAWLMRRFSVKPGLTCLWQASGRSNLDFDRWIELDLEYIDNWSLSLDLEILFKTVPAVLKGRGAA